MGGLALVLADAFLEFGAGVFLGEVDPVVGAGNEGVGDVRGDEMAA